MGNACCGDTAVSKEKSAPLNDGHHDQQQQPADAQGDSSPEHRESVSLKGRKNGKSNPEKMEAPPTVKVSLHYKKNSAVVPDENSIRNIWDVFQQERPLGHGATSTVYLVTYKPSYKRSRPLLPDEEENQKYALKFMNRHLHDCEKLFRHEVDIMRSLEHDGICRFFDCFEDEAGMYIVTEACLGGELFDRIAKIKFYSEDKAAKMVKKILEIVKHMHARDIVHRDLKPENFVFLRRSEFAPMKLIDFGVARRVTPDKLYNDLVGTAFYLPPESADPRGVRTGAILKFSDMWSVGVITYVILTGCPPFYGKTTNAIFASILRGNLRFPHHVQLSDPARNFIEKLLLLNPGRRMTAEQALAHPWIAGEASSNIEISKEVIDNLKGFSQHCRLVRAFARVLRDAMSESDRAQLRSNFDQLDLTRDGMLHAFEISTAMRHAGFSDREVQQDLRDVMKGADMNDNGIIDRDEFEISQHPILINRSISNIRRTFKMMSEGTDFIKKEDINRVFKWKLDEDDLHAMFDEIDLDGDGNISFDEFLKAMQIDAQRVTGGHSRHPSRIINDDVPVEADPQAAEEKAAKRDALLDKRRKVNAELEAAKTADADADAKEAAAESDASPSPPGIVSAVSLPSVRVSSGGGGTTPAAEPEHSSEQAQTPLLDKHSSNEGAADSKAKGGDEEGGEKSGDDVPEGADAPATPTSYERMTDNAWERIQSTITSTFEPHIAQGISLAPTLRIYNVQSSASLSPGQPSAVRTNSEPPKTPSSPSS